MALLSILRYPDPRLRNVAKPVAEVDARIRKLVDDMLETMYAARGMGLAATQVNVHERVIVMDSSETQDEPLALINPEIVWRSDDMVSTDEACLSLPAVYGKVRRHASVTCTALGRDGEPLTVTAEGKVAVCIQHEMDHLLGKVFIEHLSPPVRSRITQQLLRKKPAFRRPA